MKIALSGASGSGKGFVSAILTRKHGFDAVSTGNICREISVLLFGNESKTNLNIVSEMIRSSDQRFLIDAALRGCSSQKIIFDSIRYLSDTLILRELGFVLWRVDAPLEVRKNRLSARGQIISGEDFFHASEGELDHIVFDAIIKNDGLASSAEIERYIASLI